MKVKKAEITAFLSLIVVLLISFIFGIIEITVIQTEKNLSRICADGAIFSVFGEYGSVPYIRTRWELWNRRV